MEHIKKKLAVIVVFFAVFIGIVTIWTVRKPSQPKLTAVTWKLEEEADLDGNELSSYAKDPSKSKVVLTFKKIRPIGAKILKTKNLEGNIHTVAYKIERYLHVASRSGSGNGIVLWRVWDTRV